MYLLCHLIWSRWLKFLVNDLSEFILPRLCSFHRRKIMVKKVLKILPIYRNFFELVTPEKNLDFAGRWGGAVPGIFLHIHSYILWPNLQKQFLLFSIFVSTSTCGSIHVSSMWWFFDYYHYHFHHNSSYNLIKSGNFFSVHIF